MTESPSYLAYSVALWAIVLALERPSAARQLGVLAAVVLAYATRAQFAVLFGAYVLALLAVWATVPNRPTVRELARQLWPTLAALAAGVAVLVVRPLVSGSSPLDAIGAYQVLFRGYDPLDIVRWGAYHLADLELYLAVVPIAVAPIVLELLWRRARSGLRPAASFIAAFVTVNAAMLFVTAAFASTEFGFDRLHDRNIFYLAPLWLVVLGVWLAEGLPRPRIATRSGSARHSSLPCARSPSATSRVTSAWTWCRARCGLRLQEALAGEASRHGSSWCWGPRPARVSLPSFRVGSGGVPGVAARDLRGDRSPRVGTHRQTRRRMPSSRRAPERRVGRRAGARRRRASRRSTSCRPSVRPRPSPGTRSTSRSSSTTRSNGPHTSATRSLTGSRSERVDVRTDGALVSAPGEKLEAEYVVTQPGIELAGRKLGEGTAANLVLWRTGGSCASLGRNRTQTSRRATVRSEAD